MRMSRKSLGSWPVLVILASVVAAVVVLGVVAGQDDPAPLEEELPPAKQTGQALRPTPTPIPPTTACPSSSAVCSVASSAVSSLSRGRSAELIGRAVALQTTCDKIDGMQTVQCPPGGPGGTALGFVLTADSKPVRFVTESAFEQEVSALLAQIPGASIISIGCGAQASGDQGSCDHEFSFAVGRRGQDGAVLDTGAILLFYTIDPQTKEVALRAAANWSSTGPPAFGGSMQLGFLPEPFAPYHWFTPWKSSP